MPFEILRDDITHTKLSALVCPSGTDLVPQGGVSAAIFTAAGPKLLREARKVAFCPEGGAVLTRGHDLGAKYIIHTAGPKWQGGDQGEEGLLRSCYRSCLTLAKNSGITSVAFPLISSGSFGYPKQEALHIATEEIGSFLLENEDMLVHLVIFDSDAFRAGSSMFDRIHSYVDEHYVGSHSYSRGDSLMQSQLREAMAQAGITETPLLMNRPLVVHPEAKPKKAELCPHCHQPSRAGARFCGHCGKALLKSSPCPAVTAPDSSAEPKTMLYDGAAARTKKARKLWPVPEEAPVRASSAPPPAAPAMPIREPAAPKTLENRLKHLSDPFSTYLLHLIDLSGKTDSEVYKKANIDRKLFSKIRSNPDYQPKKTTAIAFAIALELNLDDTADLLQRAGYALSPANKFDLIISYFIETGNYNIFEINEALFCFDQQLLGA